MTRKRLTKEQLEKLNNKPFKPVVIGMCVPRIYIVLRNFLNIISLLSIFRTPKTVCNYLSSGFYEEKKNK